MIYCKECGKTSKLQKRWKCKHCGSPFHKTPDPDTYTGRKYNELLNEQLLESFERNAKTANRSGKD